MPQRDLRAFLWDVHHACDLLVNVTRTKSVEEYASDDMLRLGVERGFEIISEALTNIGRIDPAVVERISHAPRIIAFRNRITHEYWNTATSIVWAVLHDYVQPLRHEIAGILAQLPPPE